MAEIFAASFNVHSLIVLLGGFFIIYTAFKEIFHMLGMEHIEHTGKEKKNRMYEVLGLFILLIVGVMLVSEGGHLAHLHLFKHEITAMSKTTFYFVIGIMVVVDIVQSKYQKKLLAQRKWETDEDPTT